MIDPASFIGFGLAFVAASWITSILLSAGVLLGGRRRDAEVERAGAAAALVLPVAIALSVVLALVGRSLAIPLLGLDDHCPAHGHHLHLCLFHGAGWVAHPWAIAAIALVGTVLTLRLGQTIVAWVRTARALRRLERAATTLDGGRVLVAPSPRVFFFVAGLRRPRVYVSSAAWDALADDERRAALAHERAHAVQGDLVRRIVYGIFAALGAPIVARRTLGVWSSATERVCDRRAAEALGDPDPVARALVALARRGTAPAALAPSFAPAPDELALRVEALLDETTRSSTATRLRALATLAVPAVLVASFGFADPLHHALETFLGIV
jgi:Zn-dependent protease with chaperone function